MDFNFSLMDLLLGGTEDDVFVIAKAGKHPLSNFIGDFNKYGENDKIDLSYFQFFSERH